MLLSSLIQCGVQLGEIPAQPTVRACLPKPGVADVDDCSGQEVLRQLPDRAATQRMIIDPDGVQRGRLLPQLVGYTEPVSAGGIVLAHVVRDS